ncbi:MAG: NAD-dependent epimerase/dehydratase family protein [Acidobacteriota bacterium]
MPLPPLESVPVLVTGGAGFIGSHLVNGLVRRGARVRVLDNLSSSRYPTVADAEMLRGDVRSADDCAAACAGVELVFHLAAQVSVEASLAAPAETFEINAMGAARVFAAAREAGVRRVVNISSSAVYGNSTGVPAREGAEGRPLSPYASSKAAAELQAHAVWSALGQEIVSLRFFNVYGPGQNPQGPYAAVIPRFVAAARLGAPCTIHGDGLQTRDFVHVDDVVEACLLAAGAPREASGRAINIGSGVAVSVVELAATVRRLFGGPAAVHGPARDGEVRDSIADTGLAERLLGFRSQIDLVEGLQRTYESIP